MIASSRTYAAAQKDYHHVLRSCPESKIVKEALANRSRVGREARGEKTKAARLTKGSRKQAQAQGAETDRSVDELRPRRGYRSRRFGASNYPVAIAAFRKRLAPIRETQTGNDASSSLFEIPTELRPASGVSGQLYKAQRMLYEWILQRHDRAAKVGLAAVHTRQEQTCGGAIGLARVSRRTH